MAIAQIQNTSHSVKFPKTPDPVNNETGAESRVTTPQMRQEYKLAQQASKFFVLPDDVTPLILNQSGKVVFNLGLTCKYWNLEVREFLTQKPQGQKILREKYEKAFRSQHRMSVVDAFRALSSTSFQKFFDFDDSFMGKECITELRTSRDPVYLEPPCKGYWMTPNLQSALTGRGSRLTIIKIDSPDAACTRAIIKAIKAVPSNGFVALSISSAMLSSPNTAEISDAIASHPVVAHIECVGNNELSTGDQVVEWINLLSSKNANVTSFSLTNCKLDEQSSKVLSQFLAESTGIDELEICEAQTSADNVDNLFSAVRARNASADTKLTLHFTAGNLQDLIDARKSSALVMDGIYIREPGQPWAIQEDPVEIREDQAKESLAQKDSSAPDSGDDDSSSIVGDSSSGDDDSSSIVGDSSSGDDNYGSEFDTSDDESTANKG